MVSSGAVLLFWVFGSVAALSCLAVYSDLSKKVGRELLTACFCIAGGGLLVLVNAVAMGFAVIGNLDFAITDRDKLTIIILPAIFGGIGLYLLLTGAVALYESSTGEKAKRDQED